MRVKPPELAHESPWQRFPMAARARRIAAASVAKPPQTSIPARRVQSHASTNNNWALYLFVFLLPLQNIQTGHLPNLGGGLNFINVFFAMALIGAWITRGHLVPAEPVNRWVLAFALYAVISLLIGYQYVSHAENHLSQLKDQLLGMFVVYLVQMSVSDWNHVRRVLMATLLPLPYTAWVTWSQHRDVASWHYSDDLRIHGTFALLGANEFAAFCVTVAIVLFALLIAARMSRIWQSLLAIGIACMVVGVMYAYSRTEYISLILGLVIVVLMWRKRWKLMLPLLLGVALLPSLLPYSVTERFDSTSVEEGNRDASTEQRFMYWDVAWKNFLSHPVVGTGYHTFHHREINPYGMDTHNLFMRTLSEGGVIGALILVGLLLAILRAALRGVLHAQTGSLHYALALGLVGAWAALICGNIFGDRFTYYPMIAYFWVYVALLLKSNQMSNAAEQIRLNLASHRRLSAR